jgi:hypothetical protein
LACRNSVGRSLDRAAALQVGRGGAEQIAAGGLERSVDLLQQAPAGCGLAEHRPLGQQLVRLDRSGRLRPGRHGGQSGEGLLHRGHDCASSGTTGPTTTGAGGSASTRCRRRAGVARAAEDEDEGRSGLAGEQAQPAVARRRPQRAASRSGGDGVASATTQSTRFQPSEPDARQGQLAGVPAHERVDDPGLDARVPGAPRLGRGGVDVGCGEGDLAE